MTRFTRREFLTTTAGTAAVVARNVWLPGAATAQVNAAAGKKGEPSERADGAQAPKKVWLTFDDGPQPQHTKMVLDVLESHGIIGTFFVVGRFVEQSGTDLLKRMVKSKHHIGNHSYSHNDMGKMTEEEVREEVMRCDRVIQEFVGDQPKLFRIPYSHSVAVERIVAKTGYTHVGGNCNTRDWDPQYQPDKWVHLGIEQIQAHKAPVVVMHDRQKTTAENLDAFIRKIKELGSIEFMTTDPPPNPNAILPSK
jgi:peptidoglycan/xylan/chitin deacetylase (PgdA/CDA1 family)